MVLGAGLLGSCESKNTTTTTGGEATGAVGSTNDSGSMGGSTSGSTSGATSR